jgi:hypothetical protein
LNAFALFGNVAFKGFQESFGLIIVKQISFLKDDRLFESIIFIGIKN